jgi:dTDP-4-amino-4,6-dideoxygalactose transaminase
MLGNTTGNLAMIPFNKPPKTGNELAFIKEAIDSDKIGGNGSFTKKCEELLENQINSTKSKNYNALLTTSATPALEMAAILLDIKEGDEVILPSYTFSSTATAFALRGTRLVFVDIKPDTMNINENLIEQAITKKPKAIIVMHYAGVSCEMKKINFIAKEHRLFVVEDAAQGQMATYEGCALGAMSDVGVFSFAETKNYSSGEGGALLVKENSPFYERAEIIREKGTNRSSFLRGDVDRYRWVDIGSSYIPAELCSAYLYANLLEMDKINDNRLATYNIYYNGLKELEQKDVIELPFVPSDCEHNAHMFYIKAKDIEERTKLIAFLKDNDIQTTFHFVPLHSAPAGKKFGRFNGEDKWTTREFERLVRLPLYYEIERDDILKVITNVKKFYKL